MSQCIIITMKCFLRHEIMTAFACIIVPVTWVSVTLGCIVLTICSPITLLFWPVQRTPPLSDFDSSVIQELTREYPWIKWEIKDNTDNKYNVNFRVLLFYAGQKSELSQKKKLFLVHGVLSHPIGWKKSIPDLCLLGYAVYCPALPGFGHVPLEIEWSEDTCKWVYYYQLYLKRVIEVCEEYNPSSVQHKPILCGHSFGALVCSHFASSNPDMFDTLILVNPMSLLPTLHEKTPYWALLFNYSPFFLLRAFGQILNRYAFPFIMHLYNEKDPHFYALEWSMFTCPENIGNRIVSLFIKVKFSGSYWDGPYILPKLMQIAHRTKIICTIGDTISPAHSAKLFFELADMDVPALYLIDGESHNPARDYPLEFIGAMRHISEENNEWVVPTSKIISEEAFRTMVQLHGWSTFDPYVTKRNIDALYEALRAEVGHDKRKQSIWCIMDGMDVRHKNEYVCPRVI